MNVYSSAAAMRHLEIMQTSVTQNLAAGQQPGYKAVHTSLERPAPGAGGKILPMVSTQTRDFSSATARRTDRSLDVALSGPGFIATRDARNQPLLMRNGELHLSATGRLTTAGGLEVEGRDGPIQVVPNEEDPRIDQWGEVWQGETSIGRIRIVDVRDPSVLEYNGSGWRLPDGPPIELEQIDEPVLLPGYLEDGNLSPLRSMISLMQITRAFEANQKAIHTADETVQSTLRMIQ